MRSLGIFQTAAFVLGSRMNESACKAFKRRISVPYSSLGIRDTSPICFHSQTFWEFVSLLQVPKVHMPDVGHESFVLQGEAPYL